MLTHSLHTARTPPARLPPGGCQTAPGRPRKTPSSPQPRTQAERERARTHTCSRARCRALLIHAQMLPAPAAQRQQLRGGRVSRWSGAASGSTAAVSAAGGAQSTHACSASLHAGRQRGRGPARDQGLRQLPAAGQEGHPGAQGPWASSLFRRHWSCPVPSWGPPKGLQPCSLLPPACPCAPRLPSQLWPHHLDIPSLCLGAGPTLPCSVTFGPVAGALWTLQNGAVPPFPHLILLCACACACVPAGACCWPVRLQDTGDITLSPSCLLGCLLRHRAPLGGLGPGGLRA